MVAIMVRGKRLNKEAKMTDLDTYNNHLRGTVYQCDPSTENSPIMRGIITIDGSVLRVAVFPEKISKNGRPYHPVRLLYAEESRTVLKSVPMED